jgi:outer membrane protein assembly factor BamE (lipoprotein component of BamABCDE complex)
MLRGSFARKWRLAMVAAALVAAGVGGGGCAPDIEKRGHLPEGDALGQIHPGTTTRDQVVKLLGTPSSTGVFDGNSWYYISRKTEQVSFFDPEVLDQQVYVINFDGTGVVKSVEHKTLKDARNIEPAPGATPAPGRELTFLEQVLGNIGRFNQSSNEGESSSPGAAASLNQERGTNLIGPH